MRLFASFIRLFASFMRLFALFMRLFAFFVRVFASIGTAFPNEPQETVSRLVAANEARGAPTVAQPARVRVRKGGASFFFCCVCGCVRPASAASAGCSVCFT